MNVSKLNPTKIGTACLFLNGIILLFYALLVPTFVQGVHWLITLAAILFLAAIPTIYHSTRRAHKVAAKVVAVLFAIGMIVIIASDLSFTLSSITRLSHDLAYALGNAVFVIGVLILGLITLKGKVLYKWVAYLSSLLSTFALLLLGLWSLALGFNILKLK